MPFCTYCGQSFTRDEHLERHILTHTNVKPYKCFTCHMSFARRDLLHRHYTVHGRDGNQDPLPASAGIVPKSAGRTPIACSNCAKTKTKCDKKFPCSRCASRNLKCTVRPTRRTTKNNPAVRAPEQADGSCSNTDDNGSHSASGSAHTTPPAEVFQPPTFAVKSVEDNQQQTQPPPSSNGQTPALHQVVISPTPTPQSAFLQHTPLSGYEDFMRTGHSAEGSEQASSPRYMPDWSQIQMPMSFDAMGRPELMLSPVMGFDPSQLVHGNGFIQDISQPFGSMHTPLATPVVDQNGFTAMPIAQSISHSDSVYCPPTRPSSISPPASSDLDAIVSAQDSWNAFRCTPSVGPHACPRTAKLMLEKLEQTLKTPDCWNNWRPSWDEGDFVLGDYLTVAPIQEMPRDKLLAITQTFLHKALEIHVEEHGHRVSERSPNGQVSNFLILPPAKVLEYFLRSYINTFERYYPLTSKGVLNVNEVMFGCNDKASSLLVLLMIAQGAMTTPSVESRWLTGGLTEACRISLFDMIEKNIMMASDPMVLHSALLFTAQAAWSGDKWHMDIAMGQRGMYFAMLRHAGILEPTSMVQLDVSQASSVDMLWNHWVEQESKSRLIYSWVMVDQDLSLFYDVAPSFSVTELGAPMPDSDGLWQAKTAIEWSSIFEKVHEFSGGYSSILSGARPISLRDLFRQFLDDALLVQGIELTPLHLRLLLHPLQNAVCQWRQFQSCFTDAGQGRGGPQTSHMSSSAQSRLEEVQLLLQRWYGLADRYMKNNQMCALMQSNMVLFHLVSLNAITNFPEIERLARREGVDGSHQQLLWLHSRCIGNVEEAVFHCGQVFRHIRMMPRSVRPPWWAAAVYRVALILWTDSLVNNEMLTPNSGMFSPVDTTFAIDMCPPDDPRIARYLSRKEITPMLTKRDGSQMPLDNAFAILFHCVDFISEGVSTRFTDGIRMKLGKLAKS